MGYSKTYEPMSISISDVTLASCGEGQYNVNAGAYAKYLYFTVVTDLAANIRIRFQMDVQAAAPDEIYWQWRKNGTTVIEQGNWFGAGWNTTYANVLISGLQPGDTIELWAHGTTGVTSAFRNWVIQGSISPFYASA